MAEVKVIVTEAFRDREADLELRKKNEILTVSEERAKKLIGLGLVKVVEKETESQEPKPKKRTTKKESK